MTDQQAIQILKTIAQSQLHGDLPPTALHQALATNFGPPLPGSEADLARAALALLAQDPAFAEPIRLMSQPPPASDQNYPLPIDPQAIALTTAALLALQTRIKFKHDSTGKWTFEIEKKSSGDGVVKEVVQRLLALLPK